LIKIKENIEKYRKESDKLSLAIFFQPWWLDIVAKDTWGVVLYEKGNDIYGVWVYSWCRLKGVTKMGNPDLTKYLGLKFFYPKGQKEGKKQSHEQKVTEDLIAKLPAHRWMEQGFETIYTNWLPLFWYKYEQTTKYTYHLNASGQTEDELWKGLSDNIRREIRKAEKTINVKISNDKEHYWLVNEGLFAGKVPFKKDVFFDLAEASEKRKQGVILSAYENNSIIASSWFLWDNSTLYYMGGSANKAYKNSGAMSFLLWKGILLANEKGLKFDFEGSMLKGVARFFRSFGAEQIPYFQISKTPRWIQIAQVLRGK